MKAFGLTVAAGVVALAWVSMTPAALPKTVAKVSGPPSPHLFLSDGLDLAHEKKLYQAGDNKVVAKVKKLLVLANKALQAGPYTIVHPKPRQPRGSTTHDYVSLSIYSWPNPKKKGGLPYLLIDGKKNQREAALYDADRLASMCRDVRTLALAYYLTDEERYAEHAAKLLRVWFLDPAKRMNPNMKFAGFQPGANHDQGNGLIDARYLSRVIDAVGLLQHARSWTKADQAGISSWYRRFLHWLLTSPLGTKEANATNNHATYYDVDVVTIACFLGDKGRAKAVLEAVKTRVIATQIAPDGSQPKELRRPNSLSYSLFNLVPLFDLGTLGEHAGVDVWDYHSAKGSGIRKALDFLLPYLTGIMKWPYQQKEKIPSAEVVLLLRRAAKAYKDSRYEQLINQVAGGSKNLRVIDDLLYPARGS
jgi:hypothetical protein